MQKKNENTRKRINEIIGKYGNQNAKRLVEKLDYMMNKKVNVYTH